MLSASIEHCPEAGCALKKLQSPQMLTCLKNCFHQPSEQYNSISPRFGVKAEVQTVVFGWVRTRPRAPCKHIQIISLSVQTSPSFHLIPLFMENNTRGSSSNCSRTRMSVLQTENISKLEDSATQL